MRKSLVILSLIGAAFATAMLTYDWLFIHRYGVDFNDVAGVDGSWLIDWPTGERTAFANFPLWSYATGFLFLSALVVSLTQISRRRSPA